jgi:uncharacterized membrane protein
LYDWLLLFHVLFATIWFGVSVYLEGLTATEGRTGEEAAVTAVYRRIAPTNRRLFSIAGIGTILFGFWLVLEKDLEFETLWIAVALVAALVVIGLELFYEMPKGAKIVSLVEANGEGDTEAAEIARQVSIVGHVRTLLLFLALIMMIFKPGA